MRKLCLVIALMAYMFAPTFAQQPKGTPTPQPQPSQDDDVVRITVRLVQVDAVVTDKKGQQVTDLKKEDFEILEDGRPQQITNFSYIAAQPTLAPTPAPDRATDRKAPPTPPVQLRPDQVRRTIVLVVDDIGMSYESMSDVRRSAKKFVDDGMQPGDLVALIRLGGGTGMLQQFTTNKSLLYTAIERMRWSPTDQNSVSAVSPLASGELQIASETVGDADADREAILYSGRVGALNLIVRGLAEVPGRKAVILFSDGLPFVGLATGDNRVLDASRRLADLANRASVVIYAVDSRGLQVLGGTAADADSGRPGFRTAEFRGGQEGLNFLAQETGGLFFSNLGDLNYAVRRALEDQKGYYLIGYKPDEATFKPPDGRRQYHKVELRVKNPNLRVRSRKGFYGLAEKETASVERTPGQKLLAALTSPFSSGEIGLRLTSLFGYDIQDGPFVRSLLHIDARDLTFSEETDGRSKAVINLIAVTFGEDGRVVDEAGKTYAIRARNENLEQLKQNGFVYEVTIPAKRAGGYQLRVAVMDAASQRIGSANQFIEVPNIDKGRLTLSGILISGKDRTIPTKQTASAGKDAGSDLQATTAVRKFRKGMQLGYAFIVYNAQHGPNAQRPQVEWQVVLYHDGKPVYTGPVGPLEPGQQTDFKQIVAKGAINLGAEFGPGEYVLQVIVTDKLAKDKKYRTATRWIDFDVVE